MPDDQMEIALLALRAGEDEEEEEESEDRGARGNDDQVAEVGMEGEERMEGGRPVCRSISLPLSLSLSLALSLSHTGGAFAAVPKWARA